MSIDKPVPFLDRMRSIKVEADKAKALKIQVEEEASLLRKDEEIAKAQNTIKYLEENAAKRARYGHTEYKIIALRYGTERRISDFHMDLIGKPIAYNDLGYKAKAIYDYCEHVLQITPTLRRNGEEFDMVISWA